MISKTEMATSRKSEASLAMAFTFAPVTWSALAELLTKQVFLLNWKALKAMCFATLNRSQTFPFGSYLLSK